MTLLAHRSWGDDGQPVERDHHERSDLFGLLCRCFPHCCPRHISRSYCGAPLYLQVDWKSASNTDGSDGISPADEQRLKVVARFRTRERGGLSMGQDVPSSIITNTMQETTDSTDGWVSAKLIASANRVRWVSVYDSSVSIAADMLYCYRTPGCLRSTNKRDGSMRGKWDRRGNGASSRTYLRRIYFMIWSRSSAAHQITTGAYWRWPAHRILR